ncbi:MAG: AAA family ATPase [Betaproteobacteria bacterium]|nr:AAA family ATPase [Betaproteobacteria bacterium]
MSLPLAGFKDIYAVHQVEKALAELTEGASDALRSTYEKMIERGGTRFTIKPSRVPDFDALDDDLPNFEQPLRDLKRQVALAADSSDPLEIAPMLLLGEPGIGKTHFARRVAALLGTGCAVVPMSALTAGWVLSGASSQWKNARPGKVFDTLFKGDYANPVIVVDEIDKASSTGQYDPLGALYGLLEHDSACEFVDEFVELPIDCSHVVWVATANDAAAIPEPILNRMNVYEIDAPDDEGVRRIAANLYSEIRDSHAWGAAFPEQPAADVMDRLAAYKPRELRRLLVNAFGAAKLAGRDALLPQDVEGERARRRARIGF